MKIGCKKKNKGVDPTKGELQFRSFSKEKQLKFCVNTHPMYSQFSSRWREKTNRTRKTNYKQNKQNRKLWNLENRVKHLFAAVFLGGGTGGIHGSMVPRTSCGRWCTRRRTRTARRCWWTCSAGWRAPRSAPLLHGTTTCWWRSPPPLQLSPLPFWCLPPNDIPGDPTLAGQILFPAIFHGLPNRKNEFS